MKLNINYVAWGLIALFSIIILINAQSIKQQLINSINSNSDRGKLQEGFSFGKAGNTDKEHGDAQQNIEKLRKTTAETYAKTLNSIIKNNTDSSGKIDLRGIIEDLDSNDKKMKSFIQTSELLIMLDNAMKAINNE